MASGRASSQRGWAGTALPDAPARGRAAGRRDGGHLLRQVSERSFRRQGWPGAGGGWHKGGYGTVRTGYGPSAVTGGRRAHTGRPEPVAQAPVAAAPAALVVSGGWQIEGLPATVRRAWPQAAERTVEFFTAQIRNPHTRAAYAAAVTRFFAWCDARGLALAQISPIAVATYIEEMQRGYRAPTIKQHLAAIRRLFDWLVTGQVTPTNPATSVRGPTHVVRTGKTPVLQPAEARQLLDAIDTATLHGLRDRALLGVMVYSFARVSVVVVMRVEDLLPAGQALVAAAP